MSNEPMDHKEFEHLLADYASGMLDQSGSDLLRAHLDHCAVCGERLQSFRQVMLELRAAKEGGQGVPAGYFENLVPRFRASLSGQKDRPSGSGWFQLVPPFAAAIVVIGLIGTQQFPPDSDGLRSLAAEMEVSEITDAYLSEIEQQPMGSIGAAEALAGSLRREAASRQLLEQFGESSLEDLAPLITVDDLGSDELDVLLQRLKTRTYL